MFVRLALKVLMQNDELCGCNPAIPTLGLRVGEACKVTGSENGEEKMATALHYKRACACRGRETALYLSQ